MPVPLLTDNVKSKYGSTLTVDVAAGTVTVIETRVVVVPRSNVTVSVSTMEVTVVVDMTKEVVLIVGVEVMSDGTVTDIVVVAWAATVVTVVAAVTPMHEHADKYLEGTEHTDAYLGMD